MAGTRQLFFEHVGQTSDFPMALEIQSAKGNYLYDVNGKKYLDLISGIAVSNLGHSNPAIVDAVKTQAEKNMHLMVYGEYIIGPQVMLAEALTSLLPKSLDSAFFVNSGSEATEGAMKLVKRFTGRSKIISFHHSYHGSTQGALSLGGDEKMRNAFRPLLPDMVRLPYNDFSKLSHIDASTAAVFIEPVQAEAGVVFPSENFLESIREQCSKVGALLVFDEIQTAFGRLGHYFAIDKFKVVPDVLLLGKAFGGGMPLGAFVASVDIMKSLRNDPVLGHISTFGGHPVSCAAALAALDYLKSNDFLSQVKLKAERIKNKIGNSSKINALRGDGLLFAVQLNDFDQVQKTIARCLEKGLITDWFLYNDSSLRIAPPLTISMEEIDWACDVILESIT